MEAMKGLFFPSSFPLFGSFSDFFIPRGIGGTFITAVPNTKLCARGGG
jgi:hypothetical protein